MITIPLTVWRAPAPAPPSENRRKRARHTDRIDRDILRIVGQLERTYTQVFPQMVQARLDYYRAEQSLRRDMVRLYQTGKLIRVGGLGSRKGYRLPNVVERVAFESMGVWPFRAEFRVA